jgi:hypothetical protein
MDHAVAAGPADSACHRAARRRGDLRERADGRSRRRQGTGGPAGPNHVRRVSRPLLFGKSDPRGPVRPGRAGAEPRLRDRGGARRPAVRARSASGDLGGRGSRPRGQGRRAPNPELGDSGRRPGPRRARGDTRGPPDQARTEELAVRRGPRRAVAGRRSRRFARPGRGQGGRPRRDRRGIGAAGGPSTRCVRST